MSEDTLTNEDLERYREVQPEILDLRIPLVDSGMTVDLLAQGDHSTFRIHCYGPNEGETHGLHAHIEEEHMFIVLHGMAKFSSIDRDLPEVGRYQAIWLPKGCFYEFVNPGPDPLVVLRFGATRDRMLRGTRLTPTGEPIPGRSKQHPHLLNVTYKENAYLE